MSGVPTKDKNGNRISLVTQQTMVGVKDPSDHARRQVKELDKTAKKSKDKRKATLEQIEADKKEIAQIDKRLAEIHREYDPLVKALEEKLEKKKHLQAMLEQCKKTQKRNDGEHENHGQREYGEKLQAECSRRHLQARDAARLQSQA